jgi:hypothetical protein
VTVPKRRITATSTPRIWVEDALQLAATAVVRAARRQHATLWRRWADSGEAVLMPVATPLTRGGAAAGEVHVMVALRGLRADVQLPDGTAAALVVGPTNIRAGIRWWWLCPRLGHPCATLYLPRGADGFASRQAHGLTYRSVSESPVERTARKARKLRARLGEAPAVLGGPLPVQPLRMRWVTYERLCDAIREAEDRALAAPARRLARIVADAPG